MQAALSSQRFCVSVLVTVTLLLSITASSQSWTFRNGFGQNDAGTGFPDLGKAVCTDASGNVYITGKISDALIGNTVSFGGTALVSAGDDDGFVAKFNSLGVHQWSIRFGGSSLDDGGLGIATDGTSVYVVGSAIGAITVGTSATSYPAVSTAADGVIMKLDATTGGVTWVTRFGGGNADQAQAVALDASGNVYVSGFFRTRTANPTATFGAFSRTVQGNSTAYTSDLFVAQLNSSGTFTWVSTGGSAGGNDNINGSGICFVPAINEVIVTGNYRSLTGVAASTTATYSTASPVSSVSLTNASATTNEDFCLLEINATNGAFVSGSGVGAGDGNEAGLGICYDASTGDVFFSGYFSSASTTFPGNAALTNGSATHDNIMYGRYNPSTDAYTWVKDVNNGTPSSAADDGRAIATNGAGHVYITGNFRNMITFPGGASVTASGTQSDPFVAKIDVTNGNAAFATQGTGTSATADDIGYGIATASGNNLWITGQYASSITFTGLPALASQGGTEDILLAKLNDPPPAVVTSVTVPGNNAYQVGVPLDFTVNWSEAVTVTGTPFIPITVGSSTKNATYVSGSGTSALLFRYTVACGDADDDGIAIGTAISLNGGTIRNFAAPLVNANPTLNSVGSTALVSVSATAPEVNTPTVTQPTCAEPTGTIVVNATATGTGTLEYSINNGSSFQKPNTFGGLTAGNYNIIVRYTGTTCATTYSGNPVVINAAPELPVLTAPTVTQPTCANPKGKIVVNATGSGTLEYSVNNGSSYQTSNTFDNLDPGDYNIVVRFQDNTACASSYASNPVVLTPASNCIPLSIDDVSHNEGNSGTTTFTFTVSLASPAGPGGVTFDIATADNSATTADNDYVTKSLTNQTIPEGFSTYQFSVIVNGDNKLESDETFYVNVTNVTGAFISDGQGTGTIVNDDLGTTTTITPSSNPSCFGGSVTFTATVTQGGSPVTVGTVTFSEGVTTLASNIALDGSGQATFSTSVLGVGSHTITATFNGSGGFATSNDDVSQTVNPIPDASATPSSQPICSGATITTIALSGSVGETDFNWTRDHTADVTGIASSGTGDISGSLTNTTSAPVTVTFTITPTANGCNGTPITATVLVNPKPNAVATPSAQPICSGATITKIVMSGNVDGTTYNWTRDHTADVSGIASSGSGDITGSLTNATNAPITVTFTITPTANSCDGSPITATVLVNPVPDAMATPSSQTICSGAITTIVLSGNVNGTTYGWSRDHTADVTGISASGSGNIGGSLNNTTNAPVTVTFTITPSANGCDGTPITATVTVNPSTTTSNPTSVAINALTNTSFSVTATGTPTITYKWQESTDGGTIFNDLSDGGVYSGTSTNTLSLTAVPVTMGGCKYHCVVTGGCGTATSQAATLTVNKRPTIITYTGDNNEQYSDQQTFTAVLKDQLTNTPLSGKNVKFTLGTQNAYDTVGGTGGGTDANGIASATLKLYQNIGPYTVTSYFPGDATYAASSDYDGFRITKENAIADYTGPEFISVPCSNCSSTTILLTAFIRDTTAAYPANDLYPGDIRKARVRFVDLNTNGAISGWLIPALVTSADTTRGTVTYSWTVPLPSSGFTTYSVGVIVDSIPATLTGNYMGMTQTVINVSKSSLNEFITGGGDIIPTNSAGQYASDPGRKVNFGFNIKYNKSNSNLQGNMNVLFRIGPKVYQLKTTSLTSLSINSTNPCSKKAIFTSKANLQDVTNPNVPPAGVLGNLTMQATMTDNGEPGNNDKIGITVWNGSTLVYSSSWLGTQTVELTLNGGNLVVHNGVNCPNNNTRVSSEPVTQSKTITPVTVKEELSVQVINMDAYPNPAEDYFNVKVTAPGKETIEIRMYDMSGKMVEMQRGAPGQTYKFGQKVVSGNYYIEARQGTERAIKKVFKL